MTAIGDTIYMFDENQRVYRRGDDGRAIGGPIFAEYFVPYVIKGETKQSWLAGHFGDTRVNKKTMCSAGQNGFHGHRWFTEEARIDRIWVSQHRRKIENMLASATTDQLKRVAEVLGYAP